MRSRVGRGSFRRQRPELFRVGGRHVEVDRGPDEGAPIAIRVVRIAEIEILELARIRPRKGEQVPGGALLDLGELRIQFAQDPSGLTGAVTRRRLAAVADRSAC